MSGKLSGYCLGYASSARAICKGAEVPSASKLQSIIGNHGLGHRAQQATRFADVTFVGPKPCAGSAIEKGALRLASIFDFQDKTIIAWRHWGCTTPKTFDNMKKNFSAASELDGYDELKPEDQAKVDEAFEKGHVADEDIPESARRNDDAEDDEDKSGEKSASEKTEEDEAADAETAEKQERATEAKTSLAAICHTSTSTYKGEGDNDANAGAAPRTAINMGKSGSNEPTQKSSNGVEDEDGTVTATTSSDTTVTTTIVEERVSQDDVPL